MKAPKFKNNKDLKSAWKTKCNKAKNFIPNPKTNKTIANWLKVDNAIIFLKSDSNKEAKPEYKRTKKATIKIKPKSTKDNKLPNLNKRKIPAVTSVDEWTKAEIGVGAAIARGNHVLNGNCALFLKQTPKKNTNRNKDKPKTPRSKKPHP